MPMVGIREVRVRVSQRLMAMPMRVPHSGWYTLLMRVLMMLVMFVLMLMLDWPVRVQMTVLFRQMQPHAERHERPRNQ
jgi:ABC-type multidrug transport system fused ATPase/permease subunit